jgi:serine palmitoyltransferase
MPSPIALQPPSPTPSLFSKKKSPASLAGYSAKSYLKALSLEDAKRESYHSPSSTPALSLSSSLTASSDESDEYDDDGLSTPKIPPTSNQVFNTVHAQFGHCSNPAYRLVSQHKPGTPFPAHSEQDPPYYILFSTYISYLFLIVIGHMRDYFGKRFWPASYEHLIPSNVRPLFTFIFIRSITFPLQGYGALNSDFDSFYTRRLKARMDDCFSRPVTGVPGRTITLLDRKSDNYNATFKMEGTKTRALNVSSYNYLGFAQARGGCADAVQEAILRYGLSACGSRLEGGTLDLHLQAEALVAQFVGQEDALINSMGFATNSTTLPALVSKGCLVISDEFNHASIRFGLRLSGAIVRMFKHNDMKDLESLLREVISQGQPRTHRPWKKIMLVVEGLYSMEGTILNLPAIIELKKRYKARFCFGICGTRSSSPCLQFYLFVDEAHSIGAMGPNGRGVCDYFGINPRSVDILMGTFTKSFGAAGGYISGSKAIISQLRLRTHAGPYCESMSPAVLTQIVASMGSIMGVSPPPPPNTLENGVILHPGPAPASALPAWLALPQNLRDGSEGRERLQRLAFNVRYLHMGLQKLGFITYGHTNSPIVPLLLFNPGKMCLFSRLMSERKTPIVVVVVAYPATRLVTSRVRFCLSAAHTKEDVDMLLEACDEIGDILDLKHGEGERWTLREVIDRATELVKMED